MNECTKSLMVEGVLSIINYAHDTNDIKMKPIVLGLCHVYVSTGLPFILITQYCKVSPEQMMGGDLISKKWEGRV